jgi:hypothetical protein
VVFWGYYFIQPPPRCFVLSPPGCCSAPLSFLKALIVHYARTQALNDHVSSMTCTFVAAAYKRGMSALHMGSFIRPSSSRSCSSPVLGWGSNSGNKKYDMYVQRFRDITLF